MMCGRNARGFTLLELSIVLVIIAVIVSSGLAIFTSSLQASQFNTTVARMDAIESALANYAYANGRIPCPSDLLQPLSSATYGVEAGAAAGSSPGSATGVCTGGSMVPQATFVSSSGVAEGGIPTRALGLLDDFMYDGWGRRLRYAVDPTMTVAGSFPVSILGTCSTSTITVNDASGTARTTAAVYAIISHGGNGHGGYTSNSVVYNTGSSCADKLTNCHCNSSAASTTYAPTYVEKAPQYDSGQAGNALYYFDDIVSFKEAWQLVTPTIPTKNSGPPAAVVTVNGVKSGVSVLRNYPLLSNAGVLSFLPYSTIPSPPPVSNAGPYYTWSSDDNYVVALADPGQSTSSLAVYQLSGTGFTKVFTLTASAIQTVAWSHNSQYLAVSSASFPSYVVVYKRCGNNFIALATPAWGYSPAQMQWTPNDQYLVAGMYAYGANLYRRSGDTISIVPSTTLFTDGMPYGLYYFSPDGTYAAAPTLFGGSELGVVSSPIQIYKKSGNQYAPLLQISPTAVGGYYQIIAWSPDMNYLAVAQRGNAIGSTPTLNIFSVSESTDTFTLLPNPIQPFGVTDMSWSSNSQLLGIGGYFNSYTANTGNYPITVYLNNHNGTFTLQSPPVPPLTDFDTGCGGNGSCYYGSYIFDFSN